MLANVLLFYAIYIYYNITVYSLGFNSAFDNFSMHYDILAEEFLHIEKEPEELQTHH